MGNIVTVGACTVICFVLIDDLKRVVVDISLVEQVDIFDCPRRRASAIARVFLNDGGLSTIPLFLLARQPVKKRDHSASVNV